MITKGKSARDKGASYERAVAKYIDENLTEAKRRRGGAASAGDDDLDVPALKGWISFEAKNQKEMALASWLDQAVEQGIPQGATGVVVHKRAGKSDVGEHYATMRVDHLVLLLRRLLDSGLTRSAGTAGDIPPVASPHDEPGADRVESSEEARLGEVGVEPPVAAGSGDDEDGGVREAVADPDCSPDVVAAVDGAGAVVEGEDEAEESFGGWGRVRPLVTGESVLVCHLDHWHAGTYEGESEDGGHVVSSAAGRWTYRRSDIDGS